MDDGLDHGTTNRIVLLQRDEIVHDNCYNINKSSATKNNPFCMRIIRSDDGLARITDDDDDTRKVERRNDAIDGREGFGDGGISWAARLMTEGEERNGKAKYRAEN